MAASVVECDRLVVVRGGVEVLHELSVGIHAGTITGLLGPSGCGKTTLIRSIVGTQVITRGTATVLGQPAGSPVLRHLVGYSSQSAAVYDDLTVRENVRYFAATLRVAPSEVERVIEQVDLTQETARLTGKLSGGQRSRVSLAVALLGGPQVLVLDEPTVGLDPLLRENLWSLFRSLADTGTTLLVSSHVMDEAERCDELLLMRAGTVIAQQSPQQLKDRTGTTTMDAAFLHLIETLGRAA
ncbi:MAG TPA: ABC transporter ATP-binding protein [Candidatus Nanopelagicales bacterium]|jgi:ABC-2 type transport system ATP-binding protein